MAVLWSSLRNQLRTHNNNSSCGAVTQPDEKLGYLGASDPPLCGRCISTPPLDPGCERGIDRQSLEFIQQKCRPHHRFFKYSKSRAARCHSGTNHQSRELSKTSTGQSNMRVFVASNQEARAENGRSQRADSREASVRIHKCEAQRACLSPTSLCLTQNNRPLLATNRTVPIWSTRNESRM